MPKERTSRLACRAVIAVAALYALVLQAFLAGALVTVQPGLPHILCAPEAGAAPDAPAGTPAGHSHLDCCTAAHGAGVVTAPLPDSTLVAWPIRRSVGVTWRPEVPAPARAPPGVSASARAPPVL
ncbi:hypothetical protein ACQVP2_21365 [Methylobacterium aquaticum]|uniref:DUF2946 domain-containing protein n=1 Tax=Methylobacterium aquaticum TaxID=270351 RepID=A0A0J6V6D4_9HYPH|nr:hypothetical protein [Methylobacterium aquaticum]KMO34476.1 hypothetical protein VP06_14080 [Methylobacterium aquaticum]